MADFSALKTSIQNYIKENGNEEITGNLLQQILLSMVSTLGDSAINDLVTALNAEIANRGNADTELGGNITTLQGVVNGIKANVENGYVYAGIATPSATPVSGKVFYLALTAGTYTNFGAIVVPQGINILKYNGSAWSLDSFLGLDDAPTQGSSNFVKSGGVLDSIIKDGSAFDLSAYNNGTTYADLSAALTALNALPAAYKKGGMSMKYVQTSDNKYVQFRYMSSSTSVADFTNVANWQGIDDVPVVGSDNLLTSGGVAKTIKTTSEKDKFYITDLDGNVLAVFDSEGLKTIDVKLKIGNSLKSIFDMLDIENLSPAYSGGFYITDKQGYVIFKIDQTGVHFVNDFVSTPFKGKVLMSLGDSLGLLGGWQSKIAELLGMDFNKELNNNGNPNESFCVGGSMTALYPNGGFERAMRLKEYVDNGGKLDVCLLENVNDLNWIGDSLNESIIDTQITTEQPLFCEQVIEFDTGASTYAGADTYIQENLQTLIANITPKIGTCLYGHYSANGKKLTITSGANASGVVEVVVNDSNFNITVEAGDSINDIVTKILDYDYSSVGVSDTAGSTGEIIFAPNGEGISVSISINAGNTGVASSIVDVTTSSDSVKYVYNSRDLSNTEWVKPDNWDGLWGHTLVSIYKGFIEYLCSNLKSVQFYWFIPTFFDGSTPSVTKADGTIDYDAYIQSKRKYNLLAYLQRKVCEYYCIPVIDIHDEGGINIFNQLAYYIPNGGVHPPYETYEKWGERAVKFMY